MKFKMIHENYNVRDLNRSLAFYEKALGLKEKRRIVAEDGSFIIAYVGNDTTDFELELTWLKDFDRDYDKIREYHREMGCICYENTDMGLYFISDPDGYWIEILPLKQ